MSVPVLVTFTIYLVGMLGLGFIAYRSTTSLADYILGGRRLGSGVAALSAGASDMSGWLLLGLPGAVYASGLNQLWIAVGLVIGAYLNWQFIAGPLRRDTERAGDALTLPDYFENRFGDGTRVLRVLSAILILFFFTVYTAAGLVGGAILFEKSFGLSYQTALWTGTLVIVCYTFLGGFLAVSWTDFVQAIFMFVALIVTPVIAMDGLGGWQETVGRIGTADPKYLDVFANMTGIGIISLMAWGLGYFGQPHILARFMAMRSAADVPTARLIGMGWMVISLYGAIFTGLVAIAYFAGTPLKNPETAFIALTQALFNPWVAGFLLTAILAAIMSTVDSQLLVSSSALTEDLYRAFFRRRASQRELMWIGRASVIAIALIAVTLAMDPESRVLSLVGYAWAGFGASFGPIIIFSLFWPRMTGKGAMAGMVTGALTVVIWAPIKGGIFEIYELLPGFILASAAIVIASLLDTPPASRGEDEFTRN